MTTPHTPTTFDPDYGLPCDPRQSMTMVVLLSCYHGILNMRPDGSGEPRMDPDGHSTATGECIKRIWRDGVKIAGGLDLLYERDCDIGDRTSPYVIKKGKEAGKLDLERMCADFWDAPLGTPATAAKKQAALRSALTVQLSRSVDEVLPDLEHFAGTIGNTKERDGAGDSKESYLSRAFNTRFRVPFATYVTPVIYHPMLGAKYGITPQWFQSLYTGMIDGPEHILSTQRSDLRVEGVYVFTTSKMRGGERKCDTVSRVKIACKEGVIGGRAKRFSDYEITVDDDMPPWMQLYSYVPALQRSEQAAAK